MTRLLLAPILLSVGCAGSAWDGRVENWGTIREVLRDGRKEEKVVLAEAATSRHAVGIGALADLAGEIVVLNGRVHTQRAGEERPGSSRDAGAAFLVIASVPSWEETPLASPVTADGLDELLGEIAGSRGLPATFPFVIEGELTALDAHVLNGRCPYRADDTSGDEPVRFSRERASGRLVGFYSTLPPGTLTHHGVRTHVHVLLSGEDPFVGHVDAVRVSSDAKLSVPASR